MERTPLDFFPGQCVTPRLFDDNDRGLEIIEGKDKKDRASPTRYRTPNCLMFVKNDCYCIWAKNRPEPQDFGGMQYQSVLQTSGNWEYSYSHDFDKDPIRAKG